MGIQIVSQLSLLGPYDFINNLEAPNNEAVVKLAVELGSRGTLQTLTMAAMPIEQFIVTLR